MLVKKHKGCVTYYIQLAKINFYTLCRSLIFINYETLVTTMQKQPFWSTGFNAKNVKYTEKITVLLQLYVHNLVTG